MANFYDINGEVIKDKEEFINDYNQKYFLGKPNGTGTFRSSGYVENVIEHILWDGIQNKRDVLRIIAWKMGTIRHKCTENVFREKEQIKEEAKLTKKDYEKASMEVCFVYSEGWKAAEQWEKDAIKENNPNKSINTLNLKRRGHDVKITNLVDFIVDNKERLYIDAIDKPIDVLNEILDKKPKQIGPVYIVTLLYFLSKGKYPIYDQFADKALEAIIKGKTYEDHVSTVTKLPEKGPKFACKLMDPKSDYMDYKNRIEYVFGNYEENYRFNRNIDRALWVYGHQFKK